MRQDSTCTRAAHAADLDVDVARWAILLELFDGDAQAWVDYLLEKGSLRQIEEDLPFAIRVAIGTGDDRD